MMHPYCSLCLKAKNIVVCLFRKMSRKKVIPVGSGIASLGALEFEANSVLIWDQSNSERDPDVISPENQIKNLISHS